MKRANLVVLIIFLLLFPLGVLVFVNFDSITQRFMAISYSRRSAKNPQYTTSSNFPELKTTIVNTAFLEYEFSRLGVFKQNAIADPRVHRGVSDATSRYTVNNVEIVLVPTLQNYLVANGGVKDFAARGTYHVQNGTLVIELSLNTEEIPTTPNAKEDALLRALLETLLFSIKQPNTPLDMQGLLTIQQDLQKYVTSGLFDRPIRLEHGKTAL